MARKKKDTSTELIDFRELKKPVEAIHTVSTMSLMQMKLINNLIFFAFPELGDSGPMVHKVSIAHLAKAISFDSKNIEYLKQELRSIIDKKVEWNILKNGSGTWGAASMLAQAEIEEGSLSYSFPPVLRKMIINAQAFAMLNLGIQNKFSSIYAYKLYENTYRFKNINRTGPIELSIWKRLLGVGEDKETYGEFKYFNKQVLRPAIDEVNRISNIILTAEFIRTGRSITAINFLIEVKEGKDSEFIPVEQAKIFLLHRMMRLGISENDAKGYLDKYAIERVEGNIDIVEERIKANPGHIKNYPLYFKKAIEEDYAASASPEINRIIEEQKSEELEKQKAAQKLEEEKQIAEKKAAQEKKALLEEARKYYESQPPRMREKLDLDFAQYIESTGNSLLISSLRKKTKMADIEFDQWLATLIGG